MRHYTDLQIANAIAPETFEAYIANETETTLDTLARIRADAPDVVADAIEFLNTLSDADVASLDHD